MSLSILNNIPSLVAQNQLAITNMNLKNTLFQLSSGSKINSGADDPAGLSISNGLQANISALTQSAQNVSNGVGQLQTADGALSQVTTLLNRAVTLATEAANTGLTTSQIAALQNEFTSITAEINQIGSNTTYNNNAVFSGSAMSVFLSDGSAADAADPNIQVAMPTLSASALGLASYATGTIDLTGVPTAGNTVTIGTQTYTFEATASAANQVALGSDVQTTLKNLQAAVNGTGTAGIGTYGVGTGVNQSASITSVNGGSAVVQSLAAGTSGNNVVLATSLTSNVGGGGGTTLSNGVNATDNVGTLTLATQPGVLSTATGSVTMTALPDTITTATGSLNFAGQPAEGDTVTVGNQTYRFELTAHLTQANDVVISTVNLAGTLQNLQGAVNGTGTAGAASGGGVTEFTGTTASATAVVTGTTATSVNVSATTAGVGVSGSHTGNFTILASSVTSVAAPTGLLSGGAAADTVTLGATTYTFVAAGQAVAADQIAIVTSGGSLAANIQSTLTNLLNAVNGTGSASNTTYGTGTVANTTATVSGVSSGVVSVEAGTGGVAAPGLGNGTSTGNAVALSASSSTGTLTVSGATLTGGANPDTITVGAVTYTFVAAGQATTGNQVAQGDTMQHTLDNLMAAVNSTAVASGSAATYHLLDSTQLQGANGATITSDANGVATVEALTPGILTSGIALSAAFGSGSATGTLGGLTYPTTLAGGTASVAATGTINLFSNAVNGNTVTVGGLTYTFVTSGLATSGNKVAIGTSANATLTNLMNAVNNTGSPGGTTYHIAVSAANPAATITAVNGNQAVVTAAAVGVGGNATTLTAVLANGTAGIGDLSGGAAATAATGNFVLTSNPSDHNTVTIGTETYTFTTAAPAAANEVMLGNTITDTLNNLMAAVNGTAGAGTTYGTGTVANNKATITSVVGNQAVITANSSNLGVMGDTIALSANLSNGTGGGTVGTIGSRLSGGGASVDLNSPLDAQSALTTIAGAISTVAGQRGAIGSGINQMNAALSVMTNTSQNLTSSLSGIQDADIGKVVANMSKFQVLEQTGISALAQSNSQAQAVLKLLQ